MILKRRSILVVSVGCLLALEAVAGPAPDRAGTGAVKVTVTYDVSPNFQRLGLEDGLPQTNVRAILQDAHGFMWFGTQDGIVRYDGMRMKVYRAVPGDPKTLSSSYITALERDRFGKIWIGTAEEGVNVYDPTTDRFTRVRHQPAGGGSAGSEGITSIHRDHQDRMWIAGTEGGLILVQPDETFRSYSAPPLDTTFTAIGEDRTGQLWLGTGAGTVVRFQPDTQEAKAYESVSNSPVTAILVDSKGRVLVGTDGDGLHVLDPSGPSGTASFTSYRHDAADRTSLSNDHVSALLEDWMGDVLVGTANGLSRFVRKTGRFTHYHHDPENPASMSFSWVAALYLDRSRNIWVGTLAGGVNRYDELSLRFHRHRTSTYPANSFYEEKPGGALWVGAYGGGVYRYDRAAQQATLYRTLGRAGAEVNLGAFWIGAMVRSSDGILWIATIGQGLIGFDPDRERYQQFLHDPSNPSSLSSDSIWDIFRDRRGVMWLATWGGGLVRFDPEAEQPFTAYTVENNQGITSNHLYAVYPDPQSADILWLGTAKGGIVRFDTSTSTAKSFRHSDDPTSLSNDDVPSLYRDASGVLWAGTYGGGLTALDPNTGKGERFLSSSSGLPNDVIYGVLPDEQGYLWLSTNGGGLTRFDPRNKQFVTFHARDGVQSNEFGQRSFFRSASGELMFGGPGGFNAFFPREIEPDKRPPTVVLTNCVRFNEELKLDRQLWMLPALQLSHADSFEFSFAALSFTGPGSHRYAYKLDGFDENWIFTDRPYATYTKLDGGRYTFQVKASNRHGVWSEAPVALAVSVSPPLWRTWKAFGAYLVLLAAGVCLVVYIWRERIRRAERESRLAVIERDLELTGAVQTGFFPANSEIATGNIHIVGFYRPADACSGDWWWHEQLPGGKHVVMVGDVSGHGPGPAMVTAAVATAFRVLVRHGIDDVKNGLHLLNSEVLNVAKGKYHMTMAALELEEPTGRWALFNAGAPPVLSLQSDGNYKVHFCAGSPLGTAEGFQIGITEGQLQPSERLLLYTDGIPEITLPTGKLLGMRRFALAFEHTRRQSLRDAVATIVSHAEQALGHHQQSDDWTFTMLEWTRPGP